MLFDQLADFAPTFPVPRVRNVMTDLLGDIDSCVRLALDDTVTRTAVVASSDKPTNVEKMVDLLRLPYEQMWLEYSWWPKQEAMGALGLEPATSAKEQPNRVGALLTALDETGRRIRCEFLWNFAVHKSVEVAFCSLTLDLDQVGVFEDAETEAYLRQSIAKNAQSKSSTVGLYQNRPAELEAYIRLGGIGSFDLSRMGSAMTQAAVESGAMSVDTIKAVYQSHLKDVEEEALFVLGVLLLMASPNAVARKVEDRSKLNRARKRRGKREMPDFDHVVMRLSKPEREGSAGGLGAGGGRGKRLHMCRGHWKRRRGKDGVVRPVWWRGHWRGDADKVALAPRYTKVKL